VESALAIEAKVVRKCCVIAMVRGTSVVMVALCVGRPKRLLTCTVMVHSEGAVMATAVRGGAKPLWHSRSMIPSCASMVEGARLLGEVSFTFGISVSSVW
jgi:hypothetical protein